jgi:1,4-alpha-glucan branching enzyme
MTEPFLSDMDLHLLVEGKHYKSYEKMGAHEIESYGTKGTHFAVWAPNAQDVSVIGDWNNWKSGENEMMQRQGNGIWEAFVPGVRHGMLYKYAIHSQYRDFRTEKADPYAFATELVPQTASRVWEISGYEWADAEWIKNRERLNAFDAPMAIYEVHIGSWRRIPEEEGNRFLTYRELASELVKYVQEMGYTHVEFLPVSEHPFYGSWGYQTVAYYAPTSRYGTPQDFMYLVDTLHQNGIGVILDWVPAHFPRDGHGLAFFDGTHLYEHADPRQGLHVDWGTFIFNYGRPQVVNFLLSNALFWLDKYHIDGLRVDAVASMLYLDYGRKHGEWVPNKYGGRENLEAVEFLKKFNELVYEKFPGTFTVAEESTAWPLVTRPTYLGGLGFTYKWNMGWMHDVLDYFEKDPIYRSYHHNKLTFGMMYAFSENFILPFSHDEVVHLKKSMLDKMPGDYWQKCANLRLLYGFMYGHPGKKLLFMGGEFGQWREWNHDTSLEWQLLEHPIHSGIQHWVKDLNVKYQELNELHEVDYDWKGFEWIDCNDYLESVLSFLRYGKKRESAVLIACNFTPVPRYEYRIGVPWGGFWDEVLNSDGRVYGGSGLGNYGGLEAEEVSHHGRPYSVRVTLPPLAVVIFRGKNEGSADEGSADVSSA